LNEMILLTRRMWNVPEVGTNHSSIYDGINVLYCAQSTIFRFFRMLWPPMVIQEACYEWLGSSDRLPLIHLYWAELWRGRGPSERRGRDRGRGRGRRLCRKGWFITKHNNGSRFSSETLFSYFVIFSASLRPPFFCSFLLPSLVFLWLSDSSLGLYNILHKMSPSDALVSAH
jgi:hypothetical protein